jgi:C-3',4' desaturase CrtD
VGAMRPHTLITVPFALMTVTNALKLYGLAGDRRLKMFLDLQLKLYSQVKADETALLYAATALSVSQAPQGLFHLQGSMQVLSDRLVEGLEKYDGKLLMGHRVEKILTQAGKATGVIVKNNKSGESWLEKADHVIANTTVQNLVKLWDFPSSNFRQKIDKLPESSGAFVVYLGVEETAIPDNCPPHLQFFYDANGPIGENNSLFVSVSKADDGRAPKGKRTIIASSFVEVKPWWQGTIKDYEKLKQDYTQTAIARLGEYFNLTPENIVHTEIATPRTFAKFTARDQGIVGGVGQRLGTFGPFAIATRTPIDNLWLVGDSTHPGEGTAGVSYSALTVVRQIEAQEK